MTDPLTIHPNINSGTVILHRPADPYGDGYVAQMTVELRDDGLHARTDVTLSWPPPGQDQDLLVFLQGLADDWRGWSGDRHWRSLDTEMGIAARHDGTGHVTLAVTLGGNLSAPNPWSAQVAVTIEAGEEMGQLITDLALLFSQSLGPRQ